MQAPFLGDMMRVAGSGAGRKKLSKLLQRGLPMMLRIDGLYAPDEEDFQAQWVSFAFACYAAAFRRRSEVVMQHPYEAVTMRVETHRIFSS
jgi:hypothetical protein